MPEPPEPPEGPSPLEGPSPWLEFFCRIRRLAARLDALEPQQGGAEQT